MSDKLVPIIINLSAAKQENINESFLRMFGGAVKWILNGMFGKEAAAIAKAMKAKGALQMQEQSDEEESVEAPKLLVRGTEEEIDSFVKALSGEKQYIEKYLEYGIADDQTREKKYQLDDAIKNFEQTTGLVWPIK
jgi:uncharacterized protein YicC (UPF0701 family)